MGRGKRIYFQNAVYHICIRGNNKQAILARDEDKIAFLNSLQKYKLRFDFKLHAFVLMINHVHLVIAATNQNNISKIMQAVTLSYSQKFRKKYNYTGYVWQGRFKSSIIDKDKYIIACINYIHNNPVRAKMVDNVKKYPWSSYHRYFEAFDPMERFISVDVFKG